MTLNKCTEIQSNEHVCLSHYDWDYLSSDHQQLDLIVHAKIEKKNCAIHNGAGDILEYCNKKYLHTLEF